MKKNLNRISALVLKIGMIGMLALIVWGVFPPILAASEKDSNRQDVADERQPSDEFDQRIRDYLLNHPEVIVEAIQRWQRQQQAMRAAQSQTVIAAHGEELWNDSEDPVGGNPKGDATMVEFFDYNCPYCRRVAPVIDQVVENDPRLRLVYKEFPVLGAGSVFAARAALAARAQGKYRPFHEAMMQAHERLTEAKVLEIAKSVGLDIETLKKDMADPAINNLIERNHQLARTLGITGTPSFVIGTELLGGATDRATLEAMIARARQASKSETAKSSQREVQ